MTADLWTLRGGTFRTEGPADWLRAVRMLRRSLGRETDALVAAAERRSDRLRAMERDWAQRVVERLGIDVALIGVERIDPSEQYIVVALHEGFADVLVLLQLGLDLRFAGRSELWDWPVLGRYLEAADHIPADPERPITTMRAVLRRAPSVFAAGESLAVFAQGTVLGIETGFQPGAFHVAARTGRRILPVVIAGTHRIWEHPFSPALRFGCPVYVEVLEPVTVSDAGADMYALQHDMKSRALRQLRAPPRRFVPDRDGVWPDHAYTIDPSFPEIAQRVETLRRLAHTEATA